MTSRVRVVATVVARRDWDLTAGAWQGTVDTQK